MTRAAHRSAGRRSAEQRGRWAESLCVLRLRLAGYRILARRAKSPLGEIDLVARRGRLSGQWRQAARSVMVLLSLHGLAPAEIAELLDCHPSTVRRWVTRFRSEGLVGLADRPRCGRPRLGGQRLMGRARLGAGDRGRALRIPLDAQPATRHHCTSLAYPNGDFTPASTRAAAELGFRTAFTTVDANRPHRRGSVRPAPPDGSWRRGGLRALAPLRSQPVLMSAQDRRRSRSQSFYDDHVQDYAARDEEKWSSPSGSPRSSCNG